MFPVLPVLPVPPVLPPMPPNGLAPPNGLEPLEPELEPLGLISTPRKAVSPMWTVVDASPFSMEWAMDERGVDRDGEALVSRGLPVVLERVAIRGGGVDAQNLAGGVDEGAT